CAQLESKCSRGLPLRFAPARGQNLAAIHPNLHADDAIGGLGFGETVINVGAQRVQRQAPLQVPLGTGDLVAVQPAADPHLDSLAAEAQRRIYRLAHGAAKADALFQLQGDGLGHQLRIQFGLVNFLDVHVHLTVGALLQLLLELVDLRALAANNDARALNLDGADARGLQLLLELILELDVFQQQLVVIAVHEPPRLPRLGVADAESVWMNFLSHIPCFRAPAAEAACSGSDRHS